MLVSEHKAHVGAFPGHHGMLYWRWGWWRRQGFLKFLLNKRCQLEMKCIKLSIYAGRSFVAYKGRLRGDAPFCAAVGKNVPSAAHTGALSWTSHSAHAALGPCLCVFGFATGSIHTGFISLHDNRLPNPAFGTTLSHSSSSKSLPCSFSFFAFLFFPRCLAVWHVSIIPFYPFPTTLPSPLPSAKALLRNKAPSTP